MFRSGLHRFVIGVGVVYRLYIPMLSLQSAMDSGVTGPSAACGFLVGRSIGICVSGVWVCNEGDPQIGVDDSGESGLRCRWKKLAEELGFLRRDAGGLDTPRGILFEIDEELIGG